MKKRVYIIHGWGAGPKDNWFGWAKWELETHGFEVSVPKMPDTFYPKQEEWLTAMHEIIGTVDSNTFLVGHSLGTMAILRYLESLKDGEKVGGVILTAGFCEHIGISQIKNFHEKPLDFEKIKKAGKHFVLIHSDDDPIVPFEYGLDLRNKLDGDLVMVSGAQHLVDGTDGGEFPELIEEMLKISQGA